MRGRSEAKRESLTFYEFVFTLTLHKIRVQNALDYASKGLWAILKGKSVLNIGHSLKNGSTFLDGVI